MTRWLSGIVLAVVAPVVAVAEVNVREHGAKADGKSDDTVAIQKTLDAAAQDRGGVVSLPKGVYLVVGSLTVPAGVCLKGEWQAPHHANTEHGTVILATGYAGQAAGPPLINLNQSSCVQGVTVFYPDQDPLAVKPYPWTIQGRGMHCSVIDVTLVNSYKGIDFGTYRTELHYIRNVFGCPLRLGVLVDKTTDIGRIENVHFNPHAWSRCTFNDRARSREGWQALKRYLEQNLVGFQIGKTDWEYMSNCFVIFARIGLHFVKTEAGEPNAVLTQCGSDIGPMAVQVDACQRHAGLAFTNCQLMATVRVGPGSSGPVKFSNCGFWPIAGTGPQAILDGTGTTVFSSCHFSDWGLNDQKSACIEVNKGTALIQACDFMAKGKVQLKVGADADGVAVTGCRLRGGEQFQIDPQSKDLVQTAANLVK
jgi:hypothetical protein